MVLKLNWQPFMGKKPFAGAFGNKVTAYDAGMKPKHACKIQKDEKG